MPDDPRPTPAPAPFGAALQAHRRAHGWTRGDLATRVGVRAALIAAFETGADLPGYEVLRRLADVLEVDLQTWEPRTLHAQEPPG